MGGWQRQARSHLARWRGALTAGGWHDPGGRRSARDWAADAALFAAAAAVGGLASGYLWPTHSLAVNVLGLAAGGLACLALWLRRTRPAAALGAIAASAFSPLALGAALIAIFTVAARAHGRILAAAAALTTLASVAFPVVNPAAGEILTQRFPAALLPAAAFGWGLFAGARRDLLVSLRERARQLEDGQQRSAQLAREAERRRIACRRRRAGAGGPADDAGRRWPAGSRRGSRQRPRRPRRLRSPPPRRVLTKLGVTNRVQIALLVHDAAIPPRSLP